LKSTLLKMPKQSEAEITKAIRGVLKTLGVVHFKQHQGLGSTPGIPDILGIWNGRFLAIEVKTNAGKLTEKQSDWIDKINRAGGLAFVARSIDDVIDNLGIHDRILFSRKKDF